MISDIDTDDEDRYDWFIANTDDALRAKPRGGPMYSALRRKSEKETLFKHTDVVLEDQSDTWSLMDMDFDSKIKKSDEKYWVKCDRRVNFSIMFIILEIIFLEKTGEGKRKAHFVGRI